MWRRVGIPVLLVALSTGGVVAASAKAANPVWVVEGKTLESGKTSIVNLKMGKLTLTWEDKTTKTKFEAECKGATGEVELEGGEPGKDKQKTLTFTECALSKGESGCKLTAGGVTAEELGGWTTQLESGGGKIYDKFTGIHFSLILEGCGKTSFNKTWKFSGILKAELSNEAAKVKTVFPATALEGDTLESEGATALLSGEGKLEKGGGKLEVGPTGPTKACGAGTQWVFCYDSGEEIHEEIVLGLSVLSLLTGSLGGVTVKFECLKGDVVGTLELLGLNHGTITFLECKETKPAGCKLSKAQEEAIKIEVLSELTGHPNPATLLFKLHGRSFATLEVENESNCPQGIPGSYEITGDQTCTLPEWESFKLLHEVVCTKSQSNLQFFGGVATFSSTARLFLESNLNWAVSLGS